MKELISRTITGVSLVIVMTASIILGPEPFAAILLIVYFLGVMELFQLYRKVHPGFRWTQALPGSLLILMVYLSLYQHISYYWLLAPLVLWGLVLLRAGLNFPAILSFIWLAIPLSAMLGLGWEMGSGVYDYEMPLALIILVWLNDVFAYAFGSLLGRNKMTPELSPGKTWEGFIGGSVITIFLAGLGHAILGIVPISVWLIISLLVITLGLGGDLFESGLKRSLRVKDSGSLLPGHGGVLDRFDSLLFVSPLVFLLLTLYQILA